jgi:hypothetical protein
MSIPPSPRLIDGAWSRKSLAAKFRFQGCCCHADRTRLRTTLGFEPRHFQPARMGGSSSPGGKRAKVDRSLRLRWRLESEDAPLVLPGHRQVDETFQAKAARQASFDGCLDDLRREESERQGHPDRTHSPVLSRSERLQSQADQAAIPDRALYVAIGRRASLQWPPRERPESGQKPSFHLRPRSELCRPK